MEFNGNEKTERALTAYKDLVRATEGVMALQARQLCA
jgi:hypothetical protein